MTAPDIWLTTSRAAELMGCSDRHVRSSKRLWNYRLDNGNIMIQLKSLPKTAIDRYMLDELPHIPEVKLITEDVELLMRKYDMAKNSTKKHFDKWSQILARSEGVVGSSELAIWVNAWNKNNPTMKTSAGSIYRVRAQVAEHGRASLLNEGRTPGSTVKDAWFDSFKQAYLTENRLSVEMARLIALGNAKLAGENLDETTFPSASAFERRLRREIAPDLIFCARMGEKRFYNTKGYHIDRDYSDVPAGAVWVGDTKTWDVFVKLPGRETPATAWVTLFSDLRTDMPLGWCVHHSAPSTDNTLRAIRHGIERYGLPSEVLVDNGREYRNKDFSGQTRGHRICDNEQHAESLAGRLGFRMHFAIVRNARAKPVERLFLTIANTFDKLHYTYNGGAVVRKPEVLKERLKSGAVIEWDEFLSMANSYMEQILPALKNHGKKHNGKTRAELWNELIVQREPMMRVSVETASQLTTRIAKGRIGPRGFHFADLDCTWWAEWMTTKKGSPILLRYDPEDLRTAWGYNEDGALLGEATLVRAVGAMVAQDDAVGKAQVQEGVARKKREVKLIRELLPKASPTQARQFHEAMKAAVETPEILRPEGPLKLTKHDHDSKVLMADKRLGKADLSVLVPFDNANPPTKRFSVWDDEPLSNHG